MINLIGNTHLVEPTAVETRRILERYRQRCKHVRDNVKASWVEEHMTHPMYGVVWCRWDVLHLKMRIIFTCGIYDFGDGNRVMIDHLTASHSNRTPTWERMQYVKESVLGDVHAYMISSTSEEHVNIHNTTLHWWARSDGTRMLPDFSWMNDDGSRTI